MINVYTADDLDYTLNGSAVLDPISCIIREQAGGAYELTLTQPLDERGKWRLLVNGNLIKAPVPAATAKNAIVGDDAVIWKVSSASAPVRSRPSSPTRIEYAYWYPSAGGIPAGTQVTYQPTMQNYQAVYDLTGQAGMIEPPANPGGWIEIANYSGGGAVLTTLSQNTEFYLLSEYSNTWLYIQTYEGLQGYIQKSSCVYVRTEVPQETEEHTVSAQLFRIYKTEINSKNRTLTAYARHASYDMGGNMLMGCNLVGLTAPVALTRIKNALAYSASNTLATNLGDDDGTFTGDLSYKNPVNALLDPDAGLVGRYQAMLLRDNWDFFIYRNEATDRGLRLDYGVNLRGVRWTRSSEKLVNRVIPVAQKADGTDLLLPETWVDSPIIDAYPVVRTEYLKVDGKVGGEDEEGGTYTEASLQAHMRDLARRRFTVDDADKISVQLDVDFTLTGDSDEYAQYRGLQKLFLYDAVRVRDPLCDLDLAPQMASYEWDAILRRYNKITLKNIFDNAERDVSGYQLVNGSIRYNKLSQDAIDKIKEAVS